MGRPVFWQCFLGCMPFPAVMENCSGRAFYQWHYEPSFSCPTEKRLGAQGEGGKWVCDVEKLQGHVDVGQSCLIYSVGSAGQYDFENAIIEEISPSCEIHTIDIKHWSNYTVIPPPPSVHYHVYEIGPPPNGSSLHTVMKDLGHLGRRIDIFKIDCEGCEWTTFESWFTSGVYIRQILVELHGVHPNIHSFFKFLFDLGYVVFHKEPNTFGCGGKCLEYAFLKLNSSFSRAGTIGYNSR